MKRKERIEIDQSAKEHLRWLETHCVFFLILLLVFFAAACNDDTHRKDNVPDYIYGETFYHTSSDEDQYKINYIIDVRTNVFYATFYSEIVAQVPPSRQICDIIIKGERDYCSEQGLPSTRVDFITARLDSLCPR